MVGSRRSWKSRIVGVVRIVVVLVGVGWLFMRVYVFGLVCVFKCIWCVGVCI